MEKTSICKIIDASPQRTGFIKVIGVEEGGVNVINHICREWLGDTASAPSDIDELSPDSVRLALGDSTKMSVIIASLGTAQAGTSATVAAKTSKQLGILTVAVVALPFHFEGENRMLQAVEGMSQLAAHVDSMIVINKDHLRYANPELCLIEAFDKSVEILSMAVKGIVDIITIPGVIHLDFKDMRAMLKEGGVAAMGIGYGSGDHAVTKAIDDALRSPLMNDGDIFKAKKVLLNISFAEEAGANGLMADEMDEANEFLARFGEDIEARWGVNRVAGMPGRVKVTILATGFEINEVCPLMPIQLPPREESNLLGKEQVRQLVEELKKATSGLDGRFFPWVDVCDSMMQHSERVRQSSATCPHCGEQLIKIYFSSPSWTWKNLCGRAGDMLICCKCHEQNGFTLTMMN